MESFKLMADEFDGLVKNLALDLSSNVFTAVLLRRDRRKKV